MHFLKVLWPLCMHAHTQQQQQKTQQWKNWWNICNSFGKLMIFLVYSELWIKWNGQRINTHKGKRVKVCIPCVQMHSEARRGHEGHEERLVPSRDNCKLGGLRGYHFCWTDKCQSIWLFDNMLGIWDNSYQVTHTKPHMVMHACILRTKAEAGGLLQIQGQLGLQSESVSQNKENAHSL